MRKVDAVYISLRERIVSGAVPPGRRLIVREISSEFGISDTPVREAIQRLCADGYVDVTPYVGAVVTRPSAEEIGEILAIRSALEALAASTAGPNMTEEDVAELERLLESMKASMEAGDYDNYSRTDWRFHSVLYRRCSYEMLREMICELRSQSERARAVFRLSPTSLPASYGEHVEMLEELKCGDYQGLAEIVRRHRLRVGNDMSEALRKKRGEDRTALV